MQDTANHIKLKPFFFPNVSAVPWWVTGKGFQTDIIPIEQKEAPTGVVEYRKSKQEDAPTGKVSYRKK